MSFHAQRSGRLRAMATVSLALTTAALSVAIGAAPALAFTGDNHPAPPEDTPGDSRTGDNLPENPNPDAPETGALHGRVWLDVDKDGIQGVDERKGVEGVKITVKVLDGKSSAQADFSAVTDKLGKYSIADIPAGNVTVTALPPAAEGTWRFSPKGAGDQRAKDSDFAEVKSPDGNLFTGVIDTLKIRAGQNPPPNRDAGLFLEPKATPDPGKGDKGTIAGRVWNDVNRNGIQDEGETGVAGLPVIVLTKKDCGSATGAAVRRTAPSARVGTPRGRAAGEVPTTGADGTYEFTDLPAGKYCVVVGAGPVKDDKVVKEWTFSPKDAGKDDSVDSDVEPVTTDGFAGEIARSDLIKITKCRGGDKKKLDAGVHKDATEPTPPPSPAPTTTPPPTSSEGGGSLPVTGEAIGGFLAAGVLLIGGGVLLTVLGRRRRKTAA